ncbi:MAG: Hint domain-containing protein [Rhodospirillales bacterium]|nr:Hint domain-containing protein [Rhodospirillales bacterium]
MSLPTTATIPLYVFPYQHGYKIGIEASLDGGTTFHMFEFDTGGTGFWSSYDPAWWGTPATGGTITASATYTSGWTYDATVVGESVSFQAALPDGSPITLNVGTANVAAILTAEKINNGTTEVPNATWQNDVTTGVAPLEDWFWGDFGMGLGVGQTGTSAAQDLFAIIPQLPGSLSNGFIIDVGPYPSGTAVASSQGYVQTGSLQVGLTQQDIDSFPIQIHMAGTNTTLTFPNSGQPTYSEVLADGTLSIVDGGTTITSGGSTVITGGTTFVTATGVVFDTGAPTTVVHTGTAITLADLGGLTQGGTFSLYQNGTTFLSFTIGDESGLNQVTIGTTSAIATLAPGGYVNTGLEPFFQGRVMYDVRDGILGFDPACFAAGTRLATPDGDVPVEALSVGDLVLTVSGAARPIRWVGRRRVACRRHPHPAAVQPIRISPEAFGLGRPHRPVLLSPDHALFLEGVLIPVKYLVEGWAVTQLDVAEIEYVHVELESHDVVLAEGLPAETYLDTGDRIGFLNGGAVSLHPVFGRSGMVWEAGGYAPLVIGGPPVARVRALLRYHGGLAARSSVG